MNDIENYEILYKKIFDEDYKYANRDIKNNCIGALNNSQFHLFKKNFIDRINRIVNYYTEHSLDLNELKITFKDIAHKNGYKWSGPYSELVALDYWIQFKDLREIKFIVKDDVDKMPNSLAKKMGKKTLDIDLCFKLHFKYLYIDVKSFIPTHYELTDKIIDEVKNTIKTDFLIGIENLDGGNYIDNKRDIINELKSKNLINKIIDSINNREAFLHFTANSGNKYSFRMSYPNKDGIINLITEDTFQPYRAAFNNKYKIIEYWNKLLIDQPSLLMFVLNPWFNREFVSDDIDTKKIFFRSFSRRVFIELINDNSKVGDLLDIDLKYELTVKEISEKISGIIFLDDYSVTKTNGELYKAYIYLNPNCTNHKLSNNDFEILNWSQNRIYPEIIEDFEFDNY